MSDNLWMVSRVWSEELVDEGSPKLSDLVLAVDRYTFAGLAMEELHSDRSDALQMVKGDLEEMEQIALSDLERISAEWEDAPHAAARRSLADSRNESEKDLRFAQAGLTICE